ncbi:TIGR03086 family metal-binding protein [Spirilliplanes yamanashiensis]|uniref:TIGR03086 family protein n=1 Tax=Spirilliplanes yamanashiensis TaxID=42233 RepID=A0A8J3Y7W5_9ACTN|nr:TIGR03086 family metal-binding protein [Spirilliplanes yamanashiensis]MDP9817442.1 uncharacterized protein (TIGR03086 family) [Spirilliplanes yamanashiensis]GIJ02905.1 TIGR03086 family protein [Spirilliplanes yamanashiensis]
METNKLVADATAVAVPPLAGVRPERLGAPTPCAGWDVATVANHLRQVLTALHLAARDGTVPPELWERDLAGADAAAIAAQAVAAWERPAAAAIVMGPATMPAGVVAAMLSADLVLHGWDLARATGQDVACPPAAAEAAVAFLGDFADQGRGMGLFAAPVPVPADAGALDRALGLSGRDPAWTPRPA